MKRYFSTSEIAKYCRVTRFTIINWIEKKLLHAQKTAGGHRRIFISELVRFIREKNIDLFNLELYSPEMGFKWCWEYHEEMIIQTTSVGDVWYILREQGGVLP